MNTTRSLQLDKPVRSIKLYKQALPQPKEIRGEHPAATMALFDSVAVTERGTYTPRVAFTQLVSGQEAIAPRMGDSPVASGALDWLLIITVIVQPAYSRQSGYESGQIVFSHPQVLVRLHGMCNLDS
ncbi:MAG: hypothetical protein AB8B87_25025 [Granulosicoccus sp.]